MYCINNLRYFLTVLIFILSCSFWDTIPPKNVPGCTNSDACNYDEAATLDPLPDNGSCAYDGSDCYLSIFYVDINTGDDSNTGVIPNQAFASISRALEDAVDGDLILVTPGENGLAYYENLEIRGAVKLYSTEYFDNYPENCF